MNKREILIIVVAVVIGIYGLLDYFVITGKVMNGEGEKLAAEIGKINTFAESAGSNLTAVRAKNNFQDMDYLISKAESKWDNDPFLIYGPADIELDETILVEEIAELSYTGFIRAGRKALAVINGMEYTIGEILKDVGYKVFKITSSRVVLLTEANKEIILQLEEN